MPRDSNKDNASSRGRPAGKGGKGRSGAARGPDKKFAKRGIAKPEGGGPRSFDKPRSGGDRPYAAKKPYAGNRDDRPKRDFADRPKRDFSDRPKRDFAERPKRDFSERPARDESRPRFNRDDRAPRRDDARPAARPFDRKFGDKKPYTQRGDRPAGDRPFKPREDRGERSFKPREDRPRGDRPFAEKRFGGEKKFGERPAGRGAADRGPRKDSRKDFGERPSRGPRKDFSERPQGGERKPWSSSSRQEKSYDKPRQDRAPRRDDARSSERPRFDRPREDRGGERPRFSRPREDRPRQDFPREDRAPRGDWHERPRRDKGSWQEHPRSERGTSDERPRRDNEDDSQIFAKRPAFGGRGAYRERKPQDDHSSRRLPRAPAIAKAGERIAKLVSRAGLCSRRDAELWITQGRVSVNGRVINSPALDVTSRDVVTVDGKPLPPPERTRLFLYHKPRGLMTTHADPEGRPTVFDQLPEGLPRLISVGRLDFNTEGLLLLTNDGGLARALELPDTGWLRRYRVRAHGEVTQGQLDQLKNGIEVDGVKYGPIDAQLERDQGANVWLVFAIREGKNREVRNVMAHLGLEVNRLIRVSYGPFQLGEIVEGEVEEIKTRVLREQLGDKIAAASKANFAVPPSSKGDIADDPPVKQPPGKRGVIADRKGRRVLVERSGSDDARARNEDANAKHGPPKRPKRGYHGKRDLAPREE